MKPLTLATISATVGILLVACASQPKVANTAAPSDNATPTTTTAAAEPTDKKVLALLQQGYHMVDRNGLTYFCRKEKVTGSRLESQTICMTQQQIEDQRELTQRKLQDAARQRSGS